MDDGDAGGGERGGDGRGGGNRRARAHAGLGAAFEQHFTTEPELDPVAVAQAFGARGVRATSPAAAAAAVATALASPGVTVIHAPVSRTGAHDVRRAALESLQPHRGTP